MCDNFVRWYPVFGQDNCCIFDWDLDENAALVICVTISFVSVPYLWRQLLHFRFGPQRNCCTLHMCDNFVRWYPVFVRTTDAILIGTWTKMLHFTYVWQSRSLVSRFRSGQLLHFRLGPERKCCTLHMCDNFVRWYPVFVWTTAAFSIGDLNENAALYICGTISLVGIPFLVRTTAAFSIGTWTKMLHFTYVWQFRLLVSRDRKSVV